MMDMIMWFFTPDSVFSTERLARGELEALPSLVKNSFKRALFILPGIYICGVRGKQLLGASILGSLGVTTSLIIYFLTNPDYSTDLCQDEN